MEKIFYVSIFTLGTFSLVGAGCPTVCKCPALAAICPPGVSLVLDKCSCCKVCAAQLNQDCGASRPCDHHKGLECNNGNGATHESGICRARQEGRTCEFRGSIYQHGESFQSGCKHHCTCVDGGIGCMSLCPTLKPRATPSCPFPRLVKVPGQCCPSLKCHKGVLSLPAAGQPPSSYPYKKDKALDNEILDPGKDWEKKRIYKHLGEWKHSASHCVVQVTDWSQCSRSCGLGVSSRVTNDNTRCKPVKETRLCILRPCGTRPPPTKMVKKCSRTHQPAQPVHLSYGGCRSVQPYLPGYCGDCADGRCCSPHHTLTQPVLFACADGKRLEYDVTFVRSCKCSESCDHPNRAGPVSRRRVHGDTKRFTN
uniref:Si:ch211-106h11.3 n=1 Tax=Paramormyrops kingsleyae TaxID=1676925 RepID=A0A3B3RV00_9TELE|nr:protein CYR61-like [Paramormyrops kingsleyae]